MFRNVRRVVLRFVFFVLVLIAFASASLYLGRYYRIDYVSGLLSSELSKEVEQVDVALLQTTDVLEKRLASLASANDYREFVVFEADSLVFFTDNEVLLPNDVVDNNREIFIKKILNKDVVVRKVYCDRGKTVFHLMVVRNNYSIKNDFLKDNFVINSNIPSEFDISDDSGVPVFVGNVCVFYLKDNKIAVENRKWDSELFFLFMLLLLAGFSFLKVLYEEIIIPKYSSWFKKIGLGLDSVLVVALLYYFKFPKIIFDSRFFESSMFCVNGFFDSLGIVLMVLIPLVFYVWYLFDDVNKRNIKLTFKIKFFVLFLAFNVFLLPFFLIKGIVNNTTVLLKLYDVTALNFDSFLVFFSVVLILIAVYTILYFLMRIFLDSKLSLKKYLILFIPTLVYIAVLFPYLKAYFYLITSIFIVLFFVSVFLRKYYPNDIYYHAFLFVIMGSLFASVLITDLQQKKEIEKIKLKTIALVNNRDQISEYEYSEIIDDIYQDKQIDSVFKMFVETGVLEDSFFDSLKERYFKQFADIYDINFTICDNRTSLMIDDSSDPVSCDAFFNDVISEYGKNTVSDKLFFLDDGDDLINYLGIISWDFDNKIVVKLYIDFISKNAPFAQGYPELLISRNSNSITLDPKYSYALYNSDVLMSSYGDYNFELNNSFKNLTRDIDVISKNGFIHVVNSENPYNLLVISVKEVGLIDILAGITFFFVFFLCTFLFTLLFLTNVIFINRHYSFRAKLQISIFSILLISFFVIGVFIFSHLTSQNDVKDTNNLKGLSHSILIELEHKFAYLNDIRDVDLNYAQLQLMKFSQVFFADINIYTTNANLFSSSRPKIFEEGIIGRKMNSLAFSKLAGENKSIFIHKEKVGDYEYMSAYFPLRNYENKTIAYVNLPYFNKQQQLRTEISSFLTTFINIYVVLTVLSLFLVWVISSFLTKPIELIKKHLRQTKFPKGNTKIVWKHQDEIGELVKDYNKMVDELEKSIKLLTASERESAWREMARQVAHEIKNPLTPMKLNVQQLNRTYNPDDKEFKERLARFTRNMIEQIDSMAEIATAFSDFAKMPKTNLQNLRMDDVIKTNIALFKGTKNVRFVFDSIDENLVVNADRRQMDRVFINLFKNSIQALYNNDDGLIEVKMIKEGMNVVITVYDNGEGISADRREDVFEPNFTTKSSGTGIGLAVVRNIIMSVNGEIVLQETEKGTLFKIVLPLAE